MVAWQSILPISHLYKNYDQGKVLYQICIRSVQYLYGCQAISLMVFSDVSVNSRQLIHLQP